jgi:hypothetical protein
MNPILGAIVATVLLAASLAFVYECVTAPTIDDNGYLIADPYGRCGPKFKEGDPIPEQHRGKRFA